MDANAYGGTPPQLWKTKFWEKFTSGTKNEIWRGPLRDQVRIGRLCRQVEKLSWMLEWLEDDAYLAQADCRDEGVPTIEDAEEAWKQR